MNVYSSCVIQNKRRMWVDLIKMKSSLLLGEWCVGGDFNAIKRTYEGLGSRARFIDTEMQEFTKFIGDLGLVDISSFGNKFTCSSLVE